MRGALERQGVPVDLVRLESCDVAFVGRGIDEEPITIGIELKRVHGADAHKTDLIHSLRSGRLAGHQLGGMQSYDRAWLITEGLWRANDEGAVEVYGRGHWSVLQSGRSVLRMQDIEAELLSITLRGGVNYWHCSTTRDTVRFISTLYRWWTSKALDEHRSHQAIYLPPPDRAVFIEPSTFLKMVSCLPGIGYDKALAIEAHFGSSFAALWAATPQDLFAVPGIGMTLAQRLHETLHGAEGERPVLSSPTPSRSKRTPRSSSKES